MWMNNITWAYQVSWSINKVLISFVARRFAYKKMVSFTVRSSVLDILSSITELRIWDIVTYKDIEDCVA